MTVAELIAELQKCPPDLKTRAGWGWVTGIEVEHFYGKDVLYISHTDED